MRRLLLLRHGEAQPASAADNDFDRQLTARGRAEALDAAHRLQQAQWVPNLVLTSPARRARQTAGIVAAQLNCEHLLRERAECYPGEPASLLQLIRGIQNDVQTLLLVGHNPGLSDLARRLLELSPAAESSCELPSLRTGGSYRIELAIPEWSGVGSTAPATLLA